MFGRGTGQAQGLPLQGLLRGMGEADLADGRGQAQGLPLPVF